MPALTPPPLVPQRGDRATFSQRVDAFLTWMAALIGELNAFLASLTTLAAGGANAFAYVFDSDTADADPGPGRLRLGSGTQNAATGLRIDTTTADGADITSVLSALLASTSATKGAIRVQKVNDPSAWLLFDVTAGTGSGYRNITVVPRASSSAAPFGDGDQIQVFIEKTGDKGLQGDSASYSILSSAVVSTAVAQIDFLTAFAAGYEKIVVEVLGVAPSATDTLRMRFASGGAVDIQPNYFVGDPNTTMTGLSYAQIGNGGTSAGGSYTIEIRNPLSAGAKSFSVNGSTLANINGGFSKQGYTALAAALSGIRLYWGSGATFTAGTVRVYGVRNS